MVKGDFGWDLTTGGGRDRAEVDRGTGCKDLHQQGVSDGGSVGGPPDHIRSLRATGFRLRGWEVETTPVVVADGNRCSIEGRVRRYFVRSKGVEAININQL